MGLHAVRLPDVGEGVAEAELVSWEVAVGDLVAEDDFLVAVMTDKSTFEIPSAVAGKVVWVGPAVGDIVAVGSELLRLEVAGAGNVDEAAPPGAPEVEGAPEPKEKPDIEAAVSAPTPEATPAKAPPPKVEAEPAEAGARQGPPPARSFKSARQPGEKPLAPPSVRRRAQEAGVDLRQVRGTGPAGRITHEDLDSYLSAEPPAEHARGPAVADTVEEVRIIGLRRRIAARMVLSTSRIPHITIVEEVDVTEVDELRAELNADYAESRTKLTLLPFVMRAIVMAVKAQPSFNALYDDEAEVLNVHSGVHIGIATQTPDGLIVPVVRHCEARDLWDAAGEVARLAQAARDKSASREELTGSTITITSLGALGALATTPIINHPEVAIVGVNRMAVRPHWNGSEFVPRKMMNVSCSFDHRVVDGWDAAVFVQKLKSLLESPARMFV